LPEGPKATSVPEVPEKAGPKFNAGDTVTWSNNGRNYQGRVIRADRAVVNGRDVYQYRVSVGEKKVQYLVREDRMAPVTAEKTLPPAEKVQKAPYEMTRKEFVESARLTVDKSTGKPAVSYVGPDGEPILTAVGDKFKKFLKSKKQLLSAVHEDIVGKAVRAGRAVPDEVINEYPNLNRTEPEHQTSPELIQARKALARYEDRKNYDKIKKELANPNIRKKKRAALQSVLDADVKYQELLGRVKTLERQDSRKLFKSDRERKIAQAESGNIDKRNLEYAPLHTLPPEIKARIQDHARYLQSQTKPGSSTYLALQKVIDDAGRDNTAAAIAQKERIIERLTGDRGNQNPNEPPPPVDPLLEMYMAENAPEIAEWSIRSIDEGKPDRTATQLIDEIQSRMSNGETFGLDAENPDADIPMERAVDVARKWLEQVAGKEIPKIEAPKPAEPAGGVQITQKPKDLFGRDIVEPIGGEQKELGFAESTTGEKPTPNGWVTEEGKLRPEVNKQADAAAKADIEKNGQHLLSEADWWSQTVNDAEARINNYLKGGKPGGGMPGEVLKDYAILGADLIRRGYKTYEGWKEGIKKRIGISFDKIKPYLHSIWNESKNEYVRIKGNLSQWRKHVFKELSEIRKLPIEPFRQIEFSTYNWEKEFRSGKPIITPIGEVVLGEHQYKKIVDGNRTKYIGLIRPTLERPMVILLQKDGAKKFYKIFDKNGKLYFSDIVIRKDDLNISVSSHERSMSQFVRDIKEAIDTDRILFRQPVHLPPSAYGRPDPDLRADGVDGSNISITQKNEKGKRPLIDQEMTWWQKQVKQAEENINKDIQRRALPRTPGFIALPLMACKHVTKTKAILFERLSPMPLATPRRSSRFPA